MRATAGNNLELRALADRYFLAWPPSEDNAVLKRARGRLCGIVAKREPHGAALQQGLLQIVRDFCDHSNALCEHCRFPELVRSFGR
jgi:hypothetical protein